MKRGELSGDFLVIYLLAGFMFCLAVYYAFLGGVGPDEVEAVHTAWKMLSGEAVYRDFFQHHHPLFYYLLIPVIQLGGESIVTLYLAAAFAFLIFAAIVVTTFFLAEKVYGDRKTSWFSVILLLAFPFFIARGTEIRPDPLQILLGLLAVYFLVDALKDGLKDGLKEGARKRLVLSALLLSLSFLALQKAIFLIFVVGLFLLYCLFKAGQKAEWPEITKKDFFLYWAVFSVLPALYVVFLLATGGWQNYFDFNWLLNMKYQLGFSPLKHFSLDVSNRRFLATLLMAGFFFLFLYGFGCAFKTGKNRKTGDLHRLVALAGGVLGASVFLVRAPFVQYFIAMSPFVSMVAAFSLRRLFSDAAAKAGLTVFVLLGVFFLAGGVLTVLVFLARAPYVPYFLAAALVVSSAAVFSLRRFFPGTAAKAGAVVFALFCVFLVAYGAEKIAHKKVAMQKLEYVLSVSGPEDLYFGYRSNLFRKDASFFWFCMEARKCTDTYSSFRDYDFDPARIIRETRPKIIVAPPNASRGYYRSVIEHPEVAPDYERSPKYSDVYIRKDRR